MGIYSTGARRLVLVEDWFRASFCVICVPVLLPVLRLCVYPRLLCAERRRQVRNTLGGDVQAAFRLSGRRRRRFELFTQK